MAPRRGRRGKKFKACKTTKLPQQHTTRICDLSDDILVSILSLLPLKQAGMTSILSKRWRHVWKYIPNLNFDAPDALRYLAGEDIEPTVDIELPKYIRWVDQVISSHNAPTLDEFRVLLICLHLDGKSNSNFDSWIRFAMEKRVKRLTINLSNYYGFKASLNKIYTFPKLPLVCNTLTYLELCNVHIAGEVLESFLCNCLALEYLSVSQSRTPEGLRVVGPSLSLKYLKIHGCWGDEPLEISAPNLVSFYYCGSAARLQFQSLPKLVEVEYGGRYANNLERAFLDLGCLVLQIEVLKIQGLCIYRYFPGPTEYPVFKRLKKLDVQVMLSDYDLFPLSSLIKACPFLHHLKLQLDVNTKKRRMRKWEPCPHYNMKIVEIVGFVGFAIDLEFVRYLIKSVASLDTVILDTRSVLSIDTPLIWELNQVHTRKRAREQAELLVRPVLKPGTDLVII